MSHVFSLQFKASVHSIHLEIKAVFHDAGRWLPGSENILLGRDKRGGGDPDKKKFRDYFKLSLEGAA